MGLGFLGAKFPGRLELPEPCRSLRFEPKRSNARKVLALLWGQSILFDTSTLVATPKTQTRKPEALAPITLNSRTLH